MDGWKGNGWMGDNFTLSTNCTDTPVILSPINTGLKGCKTDTGVKSVTFY